VAAARVAELVDELKTAVGAVYLLVNRVTGPTLSAPLLKVIEDSKLKLAALLPADAAVNELDALGEPIVRLPEDAPMRRTLEATLASLDGGL
jgi:CO dehydrogenase nickel-insertion accessory protein CooC1